MLDIAQGLLVVSDMNLTSGYTVENSTQVDAISSYSWLCSVANNIIIIRLSKEKYHINSSLSCLCLIAILVIHKVCDSSFIIPCLILLAFTLKCLILYGKNITPDYYLIM